MTPAIDWSALASMLGGNETLAAEIVRKFRQEYEQDLPALKAALSAQDFDTARVLAHRFKGTAANVRAEEVSLAARALELTLSDDDRIAALPQFNALQLAFDRLWREVDSREVGPMY